MRRDVYPRPFETLDDLIDQYIFGSAIVVGYFLTHVYGARRPSDFERALGCAKNLGIALQLTNFARDVVEDARRGRLYLPLDRLRDVGLGHPDPSDPAQEAAFRRIVKSLAEDADVFYSRSREGLDAYAPDCRAAIDSCIRVYRELNSRIRLTDQDLGNRQRLSAYRKFRLLPVSKYWRLPLAFLER
jgi:phytoene synthase